MGSFSYNRAHGFKTRQTGHKNGAPEVSKRHRAEKTGWKKERLLAIKHLLEGELDIAAVAHLVGRHRNSINDWIRLFRKGGIEALLTRGAAEAKAELTEKLSAGEFRTAGQAGAWLKEKHGIEFVTNSIY